MAGKVLVVDDSGVMRQIICRAVFYCGIPDSDVVTASDGAEAFDKFQQDEFSLVLTDWNMPNRTGLDLVKDVRATGSKVPIVMITTEAERGRVIEAAQAGVNGYLPKPFEQDALREKIYKFMPSLA